MTPRVSLILIVKDEAENLPPCLGSVAGLVGEVVVVDTGSSDDTRNVAEGLGARVIESAWDESFSEARNSALRQARGDWVFWLNADDRLAPDSRWPLRALIDGLGSENEVHFMRVDSTSGDGGGTVAVYEPRLFRNVPGVCWTYRVHEQVLPSCLAPGARVRFSPVVIQHSGYESGDVARRKAERNLRMLERDAVEFPDDPWISYHLGRLLLVDRTSEALARLGHALERLRPDDPLRRQVYALMARGNLALEQVAEARDVLGEGLTHFPTDTGLLSLAGILAYHHGDLDGAERAFSALLNTRHEPEELYGPVDLSLRGWWARHHLAAVCTRRGRYAEAEGFWRAALVERPEGPEVWEGLAEVYLVQGRWEELGQALGVLDRVAPEVAPLRRARAHLARREFAPARDLLARQVALRPGEVEPRWLLARAYLLEGDDLQAAAQAFRDVLAIDPFHAEARQTLSALMSYLDGEDGDRAE